MASDLSCWDCSLYVAMHDVRCPKHRTFGEKEKLEAAAARNAAKLEPRLWGMIKKSPTSPGFRYVRPLETFYPHVKYVRPVHYAIGDTVEWEGRVGVVRDIDARGFPMNVQVREGDAFDPRGYPSALRRIATDRNHDPGDEDVQR